MNIYWFVKNSLVLDINFLKVSPWSTDKKLHFIFLKYFLIIKHFFTPFKLGESFTSFYRKIIYYDSPYGLAGYQSMMARHQFLIKLANIKSIKTAIDIGANVGFFTLLLRDLFPKVKIYSIEPVPITFRCLEMNIKCYKDIYPSEVAISDKSGFSFMNFDSKLSALASIFSKGNLRVSLTTLDKFISSKKINQIDFLKIDTETHELHVLKGAKRALAKTRYLHMEATIENNKKYTFSSLLKSLSSHKYDFQLLSYRSYTDRGMGTATVFDLLFKNVKLK